MRTTVDTGKAVEQARRFAAGCTVRGGLLYTSGLTAREPDGTLVGVSDQGGDIVRQTEQCTQNVLDVLAAAGLGAESIVKVVIYVTDIDAYEAARPASGPLYVARPVSTLIEVPRLQEAAMMVEIEAVAALAP